MAPQFKNEDEFNDYLTETIKKNIDNPKKCFEKIMELKYPGTNTNISLEHARCYYEVYAKHNSYNVKLDKDFDKNAYEKNKKIFDNARIDYKPKK